MRSEDGQPRAQRGGVVVHDDDAQHGLAAKLARGERRRAALVRVARRGCLFARAASMLAASSLALQSQTSRRAGAVTCRWPVLAP